MSRLVLLVGTYAVKLPRCTYGWRKFLHGLLGNMSETKFGTVGLVGVCPVVFAVPGGWLLVARRAKVMSNEEFASFDAALFCSREGYYIPAEHKNDSFGWLDGAIVAIDYGEA
jgi:hypothetical protein